MNNIKQLVSDKITYETDYGFIITGYDNLDILKQLPDGCVDSIYIDPPYLTNKTWEKNGWSFVDKFNDMWDFLYFLGERLVEAKRLMRTNHFQLVNNVLLKNGKPETYQPLMNKIKEDYSSKGKRLKLEKGIDIGSSIFVHIDYRTNNEIKTYLMDPLFGEGKTTLEWDEVQDIMYKKIGKRIHDPISIPSVDISDGPSICMDFFAGSHSYAVAAHKLGRRYISIELNKSEQLFIDQIKDVTFGEKRED